MPGNKKSKGHDPENKNQLRLPMPVGDEPYYLIKDFTMGLIDYFDIFHLAC